MRATPWRLAPSRNVAGARSGRRLPGGVGSGRRMQLYRDPQHKGLRRRMKIPFRGSALKLRFKPEPRNGKTEGRIEGNPGLAPGATVMPPLWGLGQPPFEFLTPSHDKADRFSHIAGEPQPDLLRAADFGADRRGAPADSSPGCSRWRNPGLVARFPFGSPDGATDSPAVFSVAPFGAPFVEGYRPRVPPDGCTLGYHPAPLRG